MALMQEGITKANANNAQTTDPLFMAGFTRILNYAMANSSGRDKGMHGRMAIARKHHPTWTKIATQVAASCGLPIAAVLSPQLPALPP